VEAVEHRHDGVLVRLAGELDLYNASDVAAALGEVADAEPTRVVIDLTDVEFVDSTALGTLVAARQRLGNGRLVLAAAGPDVRRALEVSGLDQHFALSDSVDAAFAS
jgi:anti-sigma B factor antagonist